MIHADAISIGPILPVDIPTLFRWSDDADAASLNEPYLPPDWRREEAFWLNTGCDPTRLFFAIRRRPTAELVGYLQFTAIQPIHRSATIGLRIGEPADRRRGFGREALALGVDYAWRHLNLSRLALAVFAHNEPAIALYAAMGFEREGLQRRALFIAGDWVDVVLMARMQAKR